MNRARDRSDGEPDAGPDHFRPVARLLRGVALAGGVALLAAAGWFGVWTVRTTEGPWGSPGRAGALIVARCRAAPPSGGDSPTTTCIGRFVPDGGGSPVADVSLRRDAVGAWAVGERVRVRLRPGSRTVYRPGGHDWPSNALIFLVMIFFAVAALHVGRGAFQRNRLRVSERPEGRSSA